ncbi:hypothetical protein Godav_021858 [Gossypium davidsonii]|uniref:Fungal lipase-type domain-containing protein n=1 Tax=Gossypium davidsonii TaxID=34287 RepID=A0A7J8T6E4_GOSDV|nr:hypothetical protein [Gossypium davidsonii]
MYEAAKVIYEKVIPHVVDFLQTHGEHARFQFTGHSLGGSIAVLVSLMLLIRNVVRCSMVEPFVTFGSPFVLCGGRKLLDELTLDDAQIYNVIMHGDIVPRGFSCSIPGFLISILKLFKHTTGCKDTSNAAINGFLNSPHPLQTLFDPKAYDSSSYLKAIKGVLRLHITATIVPKLREKKSLLWPLLVSPSPNSWQHERNPKPTN